MESVKINIKSPTFIEDKTLECSLESSVQDLKLQIQKEWPTHPPPKDQRLVYAGKLMENGAILKEVLRLSDARDVNDAFTVHLVCRITSPPPSQVSTNLKASQNTNSQSSNESNLNENHLRRRPVTTISSENANQNGSNSNPWTAVYSQSQYQDQATMMNQMYANYMTQYMQYLQSVGALSHQWPSQVGPQTLTENETNQIANEARVAGVGAAAHPHVFNHVAAAAMAGAMAGGLPQEQPIQQAQQPQIEVNNNPDVAGGAGGDVAVDNNLAPNVVMNAGAGGIGAMEDDDELNGGQRDVLDWCYMLTRVLVLFSVVYFYSSLARFALAAGLGIIFYLYNNGFFGQREQPRVEADAVNEVRQVAGAAGDVNRGQGPEGQADGQVGQNGGQEQDGQEVRDGAAAEAVAAAIVEEQRPHFLNVMATFVTTFFTSLLPNDQPVL